MYPLLLGLAAASVAATAPASIASPTRMSQDVRVLASDAYEGRAPGTPGEAKTIDWLIAQAKAIGLEPGGRDGAWTQAVPLVRTRIGTGTIAVAGRPGAVPLAQGNDIYVSTVRPVDRVRIADAPMVFVGHGVSAPERGWDDYKGVDLRGKVAVFLVNDPDFAAVPGEDAAGRFGDRRMTYYGRWTYKYEEAARRGAIAALIVHDTAGAGYGWETVTAPRGENYDVVRPRADDRVLLQGWLSGDAAARLFRSAGLDLAALRVQARSKAFRPVEIAGTRFSADLAVARSRVESRNVLAKITGRQRPAEVVMYGAHWDAYGRAQDGTIRPGANDDALGVAGLLEIARAFKAGPAPARSLVFGFWTAEERGLLGIGGLCARSGVPGRRHRRQHHAGHIADGRPVTRRDAGGAGAERSGGTAHHGSDETRPYGDAGGAARARVVLPRRSFLAGAARRAHPAVHGDQRRARSGRRWPGEGRGLAEGLYGLLPSGLRCMERRLEPERRRRRRGPGLCGGARCRHVRQVAGVECGIGVPPDPRGQPGGQVAAQPAAITPRGMACVRIPTIASAAIRPNAPEIRKAGE